MGKHFRWSKSFTVASGNYELSTDRRNEVFKWLTSEGFDPFEFEWDTEHTSAPARFPVLRHKKVGLACGFAPDRLLATQPVRVGIFDRGAMKTVTSNLSGWSDVEEPFRKWLSGVRLCLQDESLDLWSHVTVNAPHGDSPSENAPFTASERKFLMAGLESIETHIRQTVNLSPDSERGVHEKVEYLRRAAERNVGRIDWLNIFVAQVVAMTVQGLIPAAAVGPIFRFAGSAFQSVFGTALRLLTGG